MKIERTEDEIIIRLPADVDITGVQKMIDFLTFRESLTKSNATQKDVDELSREVNINWWKENKHRFIK